MHRAECDLERLARQHRHQQREHVLQAAIGAVAQVLVEEHDRVRALELIEQAVTVPDRAGDREFALDHLVDTRRIDAQRPLRDQHPVDHASALITHFEAAVAEPEQQPVERPLRGRADQDPRNATAHREVGGPIEERIGQHPDVAIGGALERAPHLHGDVVPGQ